jgi:hypothetical protein
MGVSVLPRVSDHTFAGGSVQYIAARRATVFIHFIEFVPLNEVSAHSSGFRHANSHNPNPKDGRYPGDKSGRKSHGPSKSLPASVGPSQTNRVEWRATPLCSQMRGARGAPARGAHFGAPPASAPSTSAKSLVVPRWGAACCTPVFGFLFFLALQKITSQRD